MAKSHSWINGNTKLYKFVRKTTKTNIFYGSGGAINYIVNLM